MVPTRNITFLTALLRLLMRKFSRETGIPVVILILGALVSLTLATNSSIDSMLLIILGQEGESLRSFDDVIRDLTVPGSVLSTGESSPAPLTVK